MKKLLAVIIMTVVVFMYIFSDQTLNTFYLFDEVLNGKKAYNIFYLNIKKIIICIY